MKISLNWLSDFLNIQLNSKFIAPVLTDIGLEVEGNEKYELFKGGLKGLVVGKVKDCRKHPNADRLKLTKIDVGEKKLLQIICGAPNVDKNQTVVVATIGTVLFSKDGQKIKIKKTKIRGEVSEGMICAEDEIGVGESHEGIMILNDKHKSRKKSFQNLSKLQ